MYLFCGAEHDVGRRNTTSGIGVGESDGVAAGEGVGGREVLVIRVCFVSDVSIPEPGGKRGCE